LTDTIIFLKVYLQLLLRQKQLIKFNDNMQIQYALNTTTQHEASTVV